MPFFPWVETELDDPQEPPVLTQYIGTKRSSVLERLVQSALTRSRSRSRSRRTPLTAPSHCAQSLRLLGLWSYVGEGETIPLLQSINTLVPRSLVADGCGRAS